MIQLNPIIPCTPTTLVGLLQDFDTYDLDKDGFLSEDEFTIKFADGEELFGALDKSKDSKLSRQELVDALTLLETQHSGELGPGGESKP